MSFTERVAALFKAYPNRWIDGLEIARHGGVYAYRTRISDCRKLGMVIENRQRRVVRPRQVHQDSDEYYIVSEYRYVPAKSQAA